MAGLDQSFSNNLKLAILEVQAVKKGKCLWHGIVIKEKVTSLFTSISISGTISAN